MAQSVSCENEKMEQRAREGEAKRQKVREVGGEKEDGTSSHKKYALLAAKQKVTMDARSAEGPLHRYAVHCTTSLTVTPVTLSNFKRFAIFPTPSNT